MLPDNLIRDSRNIYCIYNAGDIDGCFAACIVRSNFSKVEMVVGNFGVRVNLQQVPTGATVFMVGYYLPPRDMAEFSARVKLIWIDHHNAYKQKDYAEFSSLPGIRSTDASSSKLCWMYLNKDMGVPKALEYISNYTLWNLTDPDTLAFYYGFYLLNVKPYQSSDTIVDLVLMSLNCDEYAERCAVTGRTIRDYIVKRNSSLAKHFGFKTVIAGQPAWAINIRHSNSLILADLQKQEPLPVSLLFGYNSRQRKFKATVATDGKTVLANEIAQTYHGNGGPTIAGFSFESNEFPFEIPKGPSEEIEDYVTPLVEAQQKNPLIRQYDDLGVGSLFKSFGNYSKFHGIMSYVVNNPVWTDTGIYQNELYLGAQAVIFWSITKNGKYLMRCYPIIWSDLTLESLQRKIPNSRIVGESVWAIDDTPPDRDYI